jgi:HTH-type transcriptional regulator/antitoxin HigA
MSNSREEEVRERQNIPVPPPGLFLREELEARGWSQRDLAYVLNCPEQAVNMIIAGKRGISPDMAKALGEAFDVPAEFFANLQSIYDLSKAHEPDPDVSRRGRLQDRYPVREMIRRGWLQETDATLLEIQMARFFKVGDPQEIPHMAHAAYKSKYDETTTPSQLAWLFRVRQIAESVAATSYSEKALREALPRFRGFAFGPEEIRHVPRLLMECGVRCVLLEQLPSSKIDGVCFWLDGRSPVIGMSTRFDRIDNFWFVFPHELEHVLQKHGRDREIIDTELEGERASETTVVSEEERMANRFAANFCVPESELTSFISRKQPFVSERDIVGFAHRLEVHPGIVVGRYQYRTGKYEFLRKYEVKIRQHLMTGAIVDGWGHIMPLSV